MPGQPSSPEWLWPITLGTIACVAVGVVWGIASLTLAILASVSVLLANRRRRGFWEAFAVLVLAVVIVSAIMVLSARAGFLPYGLESFAALTTMRFLLVEVAPLAGALLILAAPEMVACRPVGASLVVAYGAALLGALVAFLGGAITSIGIHSLVADAPGAFDQTWFEGALPWSALGMVVLPLVTWAGVRSRRGAPALYAAASVIAGALVSVLARVA